MNHCLGFFTLWQRTLSCSIYIPHLYRILTVHSDLQTKNCWLCFVVIEDTDFTNLRDIIALLRNKTIGSYMCHTRPFPGGCTINVNFLWISYCEGSRYLFPKVYEKHHIRNLHYCNIITEHSNSNILSWKKGRLSFELQLLWFGMLYHRQIWLKTLHKPWEWGIGVCSVIWYYHRASGDS